MSFLTPWMFATGVAAALGVVALHLLTTRRPPPLVLPTARFVPEADVRAVARAQRPTDILLMVLRALAVLAVGAAFARPVLDAPGPAVRTIVALEWSRSVADTAAARRAAREALGVGGALVVFDTSARVAAVSGGAAGDDAALALDSLAAPVVASAALSPMFIATADAALRIARGADSVRLVVIATASAASFDAATEQLRATWPGRVELVRLAATADTAPSRLPTLVTTMADDPLRPALARLAARRGAHGVRIVRESPSAADSNWLADAGARAVLLVWPRTGAAPTTADGVTAFGGAGSATLVAPLARLSLPDGRTVARWRDGTSAAVEHPLGEGCVRSIGIGIPEAGDLTLRDPFLRLLTALVEPCGGARTVALPDSTTPWLSADGPLAAAASLVDLSGADRQLPLVLLVAALVLLAAEQWIRRRARVPESA